MNEFNDKHYKHFILKFSRDIDYREQFNIKNDIVEKRNKNEIDEELVNIIAKLRDEIIIFYISRMHDRLLTIGKQHDKEKLKGL